MKLTPQLQTIAKACHDLQSETAGDLHLTATFLWLLNSSEECQRTMNRIRPSREDLELLCHRLGPAARAWVQFSPRACDVLQQVQK